MNEQNKISPTDIQNYSEDDFIDQFFDFKDQHKNDEAVEILKLSLQKYSQSHKLYFELGYFLFEQNRYPEAKENLLKVFCLFNNKLESFIKRKQP